MEQYTKEDIHRLFYDAVFTPKKTECNHLVNGTKFESVNITAWRRIGEFEKATEICTRCGKTVRVLYRIAEGA